MTHTMISLFYLLISLIFVCKLNICIKQFIIKSIFCTKWIEELNWLYAILYIIEHITINGHVIYLIITYFRIFRIIVFKK